MVKSKIVNVVGTRPNLMKIAPIIWEMKKVNFIDYLSHRLVGLYFDCLGL